MNGIRTITLDLDDTLWAIRPVIERAELRLHAWLEEHFPRITARFSAAAMRELRAAVVAKHAERSHDLTFLRRRVLEELATAAGYESFPVDAAFAVFDEVRNDVDLYPESRDALAALSERFTLIALTNGNANLDKIGIAAYFDGHVSAATAGAAKPARQIFEAAVRAGGAAAAATLHVGDHPLDDVHGAREAGLRTVWVNRDGAAWPADYAAPDVEIRHVGELSRLVQGSGHDG